MVETIITPKNEVHWKPNSESSRNVGETSRKKPMQWVSVENAPILKLLEEIKEVLLRIEKKLP